MKKLLAIAAISLAYMSSATALDVRAFSAALTNDPGRPEADKARDAGRKPAQVLDFLGIEEGMTVVDLVAAGSRRGRLTLPGPCSPPRQRSTIPAV